MKKEYHIIDGSEIDWFGRYSHYIKETKFSAKVDLGGEDWENGGTWCWHTQKGYVCVKADASLIRKMLSSVNFRVKKARTWWHLVAIEPKEESHGRTSRSKAKGSRNSVSK